MNSAAKTATYATSRLDHEDRRDDCWWGAEVEVEPALCVLSPMADIVIKSMANTSIARRMNVNSGSRLIAGWWAVAF